MKFRSWDGKRMIPEHEGYRFRILDNGSVWMKDQYGDESLAPQLTLIQFTGLKDKNGKEIYEGDILKGHGESKYDPPVVVEWQNKRTRFNMGDGMKLVCLTLK